MTQRVDPALPPEERAEVMRIQDGLIELFVDRGDAVAAGNSAPARVLQGEIDDLLRERDDIRMWAAAPAKGRFALLPAHAATAGGVRSGTVRPGRFAEADLLLRRGDRLARFGDLSLDLDDRAFELLSAFAQRLGKDRINNSGLLFRVRGAGLLLDFPMQPLRIPPQPRREGFEPGETAAPLIDFPAMMAETVVQNTHSAAPAMRTLGGRCPWRPMPKVAARR